MVKMFPRKTWRRGLRSNWLLGVALCRHAWMSVFGTDLSALLTGCWYRERRHHKLLIVFSGRGPRFCRMYKKCPLSLTFEGIGWHDNGLKLEWKLG